MRMNYFALLLFLFFVTNFAGEYSISFMLKNIQIPQALELFSTQILPSEKTVAQELAGNNINLLFGRENNCIVLHGKNKENLFLICDLIQNHVDKA